MKSNASGRIVMVIVIMSLGVLAMSILNPILPLYLTDIGISPEILGLMFSLGMVGMVRGESSWGWGADRTGLKLPFSLGTFISALTVLLFVFTENVAAIFAIFFFWGAFRSAIFGSGRGYIGTNAPMLKKATFMAIITAMLSASRSLGALPSGFITDTWGYDTVFFISSGIALVAGLVVVTGLRKNRPVEPLPASVSPTPTEEPVPPRRGLNPRSFSFQCLVTFLHFIGLGVTITFLPLLATQVVGVAATEVGIIFTIRGLATVVLGVPMGMLADRFGKRRFMVLGLLVTALGMTGTAYASSYLWLILFSIVGSCGLAIFSPAALGLLSDSIPLHRQGTAMGVYGGVCENTGIIAGSALGGFVWGAWGPRPTFLMATAASILGVFFCFGLKMERDTDEP